MRKTTHKSAWAALLLCIVHANPVLGQCPAGQFNLTVCRNCPAGSYRNTSGGTSLSDCTPCAAGKFGATPGLTSESLACTGSCSSGLWSAPGSSSAQACTGCQPYSSTLISTGTGTLFKDVPGYHVHQYKATTATVQFSRDVVADVLLVGGGGSGGGDIGGGGGAGAVLYYGSYKFSRALSYTFTVGTGGSAPTAASATGNDGNPSKITDKTNTKNIFVAVGGGGGGTFDSSSCDTVVTVGRTGGSSGGGGSCFGVYINSSIVPRTKLVSSSPSLSNELDRISGYKGGFAGGAGLGHDVHKRHVSGGGGGGAGETGLDSSSERAPRGGNGIDQVSWAGSQLKLIDLFGSAYSSLAVPDAVDLNYYIAGGGGASGSDEPSFDWWLPWTALCTPRIAGGKGGGGTSRDCDAAGVGSTPTQGRVNTGSGGGAGRMGLGSEAEYKAAAGGSGLILLRYSLCQPCIAGTFLENAGASGVCSVCSSGNYSTSGQTVCNNCPANSISVSGVCRAATGYFGPTLRMFDGTSSVFENLGSVTHGIVPTGTLPAYGTVGPPSRTAAFFDSSANNGYVTLSSSYTEMTISFRMYLTGDYDGVTQYQFAPFNMRVSSATASTVRIELDGRAGVSTQGTPYYSITYNGVDLNGIGQYTYVQKNTWVLFTLLIPQYDPNTNYYWPDLYEGGSSVGNTYTQATGPLLMYDRIILGANLVDGRYFKGYLQDVRLYSKALERTQVRDLSRGAVYFPCFASCAADQTFHCTPNGTGVCCGQGQFFRDGLDTACSSCAAGTFSPDGSGSTGCQACAVGKYSLVNAATCSPCTNSLSANQYYSTSATTATGCARATCTNALANQYYSSPVGAYQRVTSTSCSVTNCSNAKVYQYYFGGGGASAPTTNTCPIAPTNCTNTRAPGYYFSSAGFTEPDSCGQSKCNNTLRNNQYYSGHGDISFKGCAVGTCTNTLGQGQYYSAPSFNNPTGCNISACNDPAPNTQFPPTALNLNATCAFICSPGYYLNTQMGACDACPPQTFNPNAGGVGIMTCQICTAGLDYPASLADLDTNSNGLSKCKWSCRSGYDAAADGSLACYSTVTSAINELSIQNFAVLADQVNSSHTRLARLNFSSETTETLATLQASVQSLVLRPDGASGYALDASRPHAVFTFPISSQQQPSLALLAGNLSSQGSANGSFLVARFRNLTLLASPGAGQFLLAVDQDGTSLRKLDLATSQVSTLQTFSQGKVRAAACSQDGSFAIVALDTEIYSIHTTSGALTLVAGSTAANYTDGQGAAARFRAPSSVAVSPDGALAYVVHPASANTSSDTVLRRIDLATKVVTTAARDGRLAGGLLSVGLAASRSVWVASRSNSTVTQLNSSTFAPLVVYGGAGQGVADDLLSGLSHTEKFWSISAFAVWACNSPGYDCSSTSPLFATACEKGYTSDGVSACTPCAAGTYAQSYGSPACYPCNAPNYTTSQRSTSCKTCQTDCGDQYRAGCGGASSGTCQTCQPCPAGQRRAQCGNLSGGLCEPCPNLPAAHQYYVANPECGVSDCTNPLPAGYYWSLTGWTSATNCSYAQCANKPGNSSYPAYNNLDSACKYACNPGYTGAACQPCAAGFYAPFSDSPQCYPCPEGTFAPSQGSSACSPCPAGSFMPYRNATRCLPCDNGTFAASEQTQLCSPCQPGSVSLGGSTACAPCTPGSYADQASLTSCLPCDPGFFTTGAQTACDTCAAGSFTVSSVGPCSSCLQGQFSQRSSTACSACPAYTFASVPSEACTPCVQEVHYPLNAVLLNTTGNSACDFRCAQNFTELVTAQLTVCVQLNSGMFTFIYDAYIQQPTLTPAQIQDYQTVMAQALGVREFSIQIMGTNQSYIFVTFRNFVLQVVVQSSTQTNAVLLSKQVYTSTFQNNINQAVQARSLPSAFVLPNSLQYLFDLPKETSTPPGQTTPPSSNGTSDNILPEFSTSRQISPSHTLSYTFVLVSLAAIHLS